MLFSSITFLYYFLPIVLIVYFLTPKKGKNLLLMIASFIFYAWGEPIYLLLMLLSITVHYVCALLIERHQGKSYLSRLWLFLALAFSLALLGYFKYADFFIQNFNAVTGLSVPLLNVALPIGISFYTFQIMSYTIDVYRQQTPAQRSIIKLATYVSMFPQLIAGPIVRYVDVAAALDEREHSVAKVRSGLRRFIIGLAKKVILANSLGELCQIFLETPDQTVLFHWIYAIAFTLQIYFDFSGYSDMAIGLGRILGFEFLENFNYPFIAKSITEFWRRWHISLSSWFRDYLYIPLGGSRVGRGRLVLNILIVWLLTGFWHGAAWNFVVWGLIFAVLLIVEKLWTAQLLQKAPDWLCHIYVMLIVLLSFVVFGAPDLMVAAERIGAMFGAGGLPLADTVTYYYLRSYGLILLLAAFGSTPLIKRVVEKLQFGRGTSKMLTVAEPIANIMLLLVVTGYLLDSSFNPFLYFRF
ncbi:MAG: MBOAT family protein [Eubacteriales bacterium]|nr:MBOAT family protein [Eubacteriales bacterium]